MTKIKNLRDEVLLKKIQEQITLLKNGLSSLNSEYSLKELYKEFYPRFIFTSKDYQTCLDNFNKGKISEEDFRKQFATFCTKKQIELGIVF